MLPFGTTRNDYRRATGMFFSFFMFAPVRDAGLRIAVAVFAADEASMVRLNDGLSIKM